DASSAMQKRMFGLAVVSAARTGPQQRQDPARRRERRAFMGGGSVSISGVGRGMDAGGYDTTLPARSASEGIVPSLALRAGSASGWYSLFLQEERDAPHIHHLLARNLQGPARELVRANASKST